MKIKRLINSLHYLFIITMFFSGTFIFLTWYRDYQKKMYWSSIAEKREVQQEWEETDILPEYRMLYEENPDMIGWIMIEDTNINYPVMQSKKNPEYYLRRNFSKEWDGNGTPFVDYRCEVIPSHSYNIIIYGHYTQTDTMFRHLLNYADKDWYKKNKMIQFDTLVERNDYEVVAAFYYDASEAVLKEAEDKKEAASYEFYNYIELDNEEGFALFKEQIQKRKLYETEADFDETEELLTLICCAPKEYSGMEEGRFVVMAKKVFD